MRSFSLLPALSWLDSVRHRCRSTSLTPTLAVGRRGEDLAHRYLQRLGYCVVARNFVTKSGRFEVDLVAWDGEDLVMVEVKTRTVRDAYAPEIRIDEEKVEHLTYAAKEYCRRADVDYARVRVDVVAIVLEPEVRIQLFRDALRDWN